MSRKLALLGGGGVRTPLVIFGVNESRRHLDVDEMALYDLDPDRARIICRLGQALIAREGGALRLRVAEGLEDAVSGASFVLSAIRPGGNEARTIDERISIENGFPGQETTGPGGVAMALRTIRAAIDYARAIERLSPDAWLINFTNPVGVVTQAISHHSHARVIGICDTPTELFHRIAAALGAPLEAVHCDYAGLNHLGWVHRVLLRGKDVTSSILADDKMLLSLYQANLFEPALLRALGLIPTEYLFFYYSRRRALANQLAARATRGEEIAKMNEALFRELQKSIASENGQDALSCYIAYLNQRSGSYMQLEASADSTFDSPHNPSADPFHVATGYHRIALDVMNALCSKEPRRVVVNVRNHGAIPDVDAEDIVEAPCAISSTAIVPDIGEPLPEEARGLLLAVKAYEHAVVQAAVSGSLEQARKAMLLYPAIGEWEPSENLLKDLSSKSPGFPHLA